MKVLSPKQHGYLDYLIVAVFALAPSLFGFTGIAATVTYALAGVHLLMTLATAFPLGVLKLIPFTVHGAIEFITAIGLLAMPWLLGFTDQPAAKNFYLGSAIVVFIVWAITDYKAADGTRRAAARV